MPQACSTRAPCSFWNALIIDGGHALPPITTCLSELIFFPDVFAAASKPSHTVGTPSALVTFSASINSSRLFPSIPGPGSTSLLPTIAAAYGTPHALTWNIGTTGKVTSCAEMPSASTIAIAKLCSTVLRCE